MRFTLRLPETIGRNVLDGLAYVGGLARLGASATYYVFVAPFRSGRIHAQRTVHQAMEVGVRALPVLSLIGFFVGLIMALQGAYELRSLGAMQFVPSAVGISMTRELGPLMTAVVVIGRSGSAFAAEIGTMKVSEEVDALETMAIDPVPFLVAPKFLAMLIMLPCLSTWCDFMGILGGAVFSVKAIDMTLAGYFRSILDALLMRDIVTGLIKSVVFGAVITTVGCFEGFRTGEGAEAVGSSTTAAVVNSIFLVVGVDLIFTAIFYFVVGA